MWRQTRSMGSSSASSRICLQQHNPQYNRYVTLFYYLSEGISSSLDLAKLSIGKKFSNAASAMAEQAIDVQKEARIRLEKFNARYKAVVDKGGEKRSSKKEA